MSSREEWVSMAIDLLEKTPLRDSYLVSLWSNALTALGLKEIERHLDVGRDEFNVLFTLAARGKSLASEICQLNGRPKNSISRAVNRLAERGAIIREPLEEDRRKEYLSLTEVGQDLYDRALPIFLERQRQLLSPLTYEERRTIEALFKKTLTEGPDWRTTL